MRKAAENIENPFKTDRMGKYNFNQNESRLNRRGSAYELEEEKMPMIASPNPVRVLHSRSRSSVHTLTRRTATTVSSIARNSIPKLFDEDK